MRLQARLSQRESLHVLPQKVSMNARTARHFRRSALLTLVVGAAACGKDAPADPSSIPGSLTAESPLTRSAPAAGTIEEGVSVLVRARNGQPLSGVPVTFMVADGAGSVEMPNTRTDDRGIASSGPWTLGPMARDQRLTARVARLDSLTFTAAAQAGAPASIALPSVGLMTGTVGADMVTPPSVFVRDAHGNGVAGARVLFSVRTGGGTATGTERLTDAKGRAALGGLRLGTRSGPQDIAVAVSRLPEVILTVDAVAGPAEVARLTAGSDQIAYVGTTLDVAPVIAIRDAFDNPVARRPVTARVSQGGGVLAGNAVTSDDGTLTLNRWTMGSSEGLNAVALDIDGLPMTVYAKAVPVSTFDIQFRYLSPVTERQRAAFERAAARWRKVIVGDVVDITVTRTSFCGLQGSSLNEVVDDLVIFVELVAIDGPGQVLGSAGPCAVRSTNGVPHVGAMRFDTDDVAQMEANGRFGDVVLHEIGHILGLGTMWTYHGFVVGAGGTDPYYQGVSARAGFITAGGALYGGNAIPVENTGGPGTRDSHWRETVLNAEVMTGFVEAPGVRMPLSLMTIGALEDLGYDVTVWGDDPFAYATSPLLSGTIARRPSAPDMELIEVPFPPPDVMSATGKSSPISARITRPSPQRRLMRTVPRPVQELEVRRPR